MQQLWWRCSANRVPRRESAADSRRSASRSERNNRFFKGLYLPKGDPSRAPEVFRKYGLWVRKDQGSRRAASRFRLAKSPSDKFFCSFLDHPGSHLDQVYDSPPAYFWGPIPAWLTVPLQ